MRISLHACIYDSENMIYISCCFVTPLDHMKDRSVTPSKSDFPIIYTGGDCISPERQDAPSLVDPKYR